MVQPGALGLQLFSLTCLATGTRHLDRLGLTCVPRLHTSQLSLTLSRAALEMANAILFRHVLIVMNG